MHETSCFYVLLIPSNGNNDVIVSIFCIRTNDKTKINIINTMDRTNIWIESSIFGVFDFMLGNKMIFYFIN